MKYLLSTCVLSLVASGFLCGCRTNPYPIPYYVQEIGVVKDVLPMATQPDLEKWQKLKPGMTEEEVLALMGKPYEKTPRPPDDTVPNEKTLYHWKYGGIKFSSFTTSIVYDFLIMFHQGRVEEIYDPWDGKFSPDGRPTIPEQVLPGISQHFNHYPRLMDFRWHPSSGVYPIEYRIEIQALCISQDQAEHFEDYIRDALERDRQTPSEVKLTAKQVREGEKSYEQLLRQQQGIVSVYTFETHDLYMPLAWCGGNTGRWRVQAKNAKGTSAWTPWRYFKFER